MKKIYEINSILYIFVPRTLFTYYALQELGIKYMVVHVADVPTTQYESVMKDDSVDSEKLT